MSSRSVGQKEGSQCRGVKDGRERGRSFTRVDGGWTRGEINNYPACAVIRPLVEDLGDQLQERGKEAIAYILWRKLEGAVKEGNT